MAGQMIWPASRSVASWPVADYPVSVAANRPLGRRSLVAAMHNALRYKLHFGPYRAPRFRYGADTFCEVRGEVQIVGLSSSRIPWPLGRRRGHSSRGLVVYGALAKAVRRESNQAVAHWWGVTGQTVTVWRKALGVGSTTGTQRLRSRYGHSLAARRGLRRAQAKARDPVRRAKIAAARRGKPRPRHVVEAVIAAHLGSRHTKVARRKMSLAHKSRGTWPPAAGRPWTAEEDGLIRTLSGKEVARRTGRTLNAVYMRRISLGLPDGRTRRERKRNGRDKR